MKIASLAPSVTEILYELGAQDEIVCSTVFCDYPPAAKHLPKIGSWINVDIAKLEELRPDLVFTSSLLQGKLTERLKEKGLNVVNINPTRLAEVVESYNQIGQLVGRQQEAEKVSNRLYRKIMGYYLHSGEKAAVRVYCEEWSSPPMAAGNWVPDLVELAGGRTLLEAGSLSRRFPLEELYNFDPEVIILHICGMDNSVSPVDVARRPGWERLPAVRNGRIYTISDSFINRPTSRLFTGLEKLREIIGQYK